MIVSCLVCGRPFSLHHLRVKPRCLPLYPILKRLEGAGLLTVRTAEHDGRLRKYYRITGQGISRIEEFKQDWTEILSIYRFITKEDHRHDEK